MGVEREGFFRYLENFNVDEGEFNLLNAKNLLRIIKDGDLEIMFPTKELLENQGVKRT